MINSFNLIQNIGCFDSHTNGAHHPFDKLTLLYAENGRGKTTLAAIIRSLATGDPISINERKSLAAQHPPRAVLSCAGSPPDAIFENGLWNRNFENIVIFDDIFVDENVYSGLVVDSRHRQNLHELILGSQGVALNQQLQNFIEKIKRHTSKIKSYGDAIPARERGTLSVDEFCALPQIPNIDAEIKSVEQNIVANRQKESIRNAPNFQKIILPAIDLAAIEGVISSGLPDIDTAATARVQTHLQSIGKNSEQWVAEGMLRQNARQKGEENNCVFCDQDLSSELVINHYRAFFSETYQNYRQNIQDSISEFNQEHCADADIVFERSVNEVTKCQRFWSNFGEIPEVVIDPDAIIVDWKAARDQVTRLLEKKKGAPLDGIEISGQVRSVVDTYETRRNEIASINQKLGEYNDIIASIKQQTASTSMDTLTTRLDKFKATQARYITSTVALCNTYLAEQQAKVNTAQQRDQAREALNNYRIQVFPNYETKTNEYLQKFNVGYHLGSVAANNIQSGSTCNYNVIVNDTPVPVGVNNPEPDGHSFKNVLSAGDRNTLAIAFFLASIALDPNKKDKVVVIDDPVSSLDEHRLLTTTQEVRRLSNQVSQVVILSHNKSFLCKLWQRADRLHRASYQVVRQGTGSIIDNWDINNDLITDNDIRHNKMRYYLSNGGANERGIAQLIRPSLEAFFRVAYPEHFSPGTLLGRFYECCIRKVGTDQKILTQNDINELRDIVEYANRFHHDTDATSESNVINSEELKGFVKRVLDFTRRS